MVKSYLFLQPKALAKRQSSYACFLGFDRPRKQIALESVRGDFLGLHRQGPTEAPFRKIARVNVIVMPLRFRSTPAFQRT